MLNVSLVLTSKQYAMFKNLAMPPFSPLALWRFQTLKMVFLCVFCAIGRMVRWPLFQLDKLEKPVGFDSLKLKKRREK